MQYRPFGKQNFRCSEIGFGAWAIGGAWGAQADSDSLAALHRDGLTLLLVEQNDTAALAIADRAVVLETGRVRLQGSAAELRHDPELQALYLGGGG